MSTGAGRMPTKPGAGARVSDVRKSVQAGKGGKPKPPQAARSAESDERKLRKDPASERDKWMKDNAKAKKNRPRKDKVVEERPPMGLGFAIMVTLALGGGGGYGLLAAEMGSFELAARHIAAAPHCETAKLVGLAPALRGEPGYWAHNDDSGAGLSCRD